MKKISFMGFLKWMSACLFAFLIFTGVLSSLKTKSEMYFRYIENPEKDTNIQITVNYSEMDSSTTDLVFHSDDQEVRNVIVKKMGEPKTSTSYILTYSFKRPLDFQAKKLMTHKQWMQMMMDIEVSNLETIFKIQIIKKSGAEDRIIG